MADEPTGEENVKLSPINTSGSSSTGVDLKWPDTTPLVGGGGLKFWTPELPINIYVNPFGLVQITLKSPSWGYLDDNGASDQKGWGKYPRMTVKQQWEKKKKTLKAMNKKTSSLVNKPGAFQQIDLFKSFSVNVNFQLLALAEWDSDKKLVQGEVAGQIFASMNFTITENFFAGPIPVLITFALDVSLIFGLSAGAYVQKKDDKESLVDAALDVSRWQWDYSNTGFSMTFNVTPSLSVGVGLRGVVSVSVKGSITLQLYLGVPMGTQPKELPSPHLSAGWSAQISLVLELFFFTKTFSLYEKEFSNFADNWDGKESSLATQAEGALLGAMADMTLEELLSELEPITDSMLASTSEASIPAQALVAQADEAPSAWDVTREERVGTLDNGEHITYFVYSYARHEDTAELAPQQNTSAEAQGEGLSVTQPEQNPEVQPLSDELLEAAETNLEAATEAVGASPQDSIARDAASLAAFAELDGAAEGALEQSADAEGAVAEEGAPIISEWAAPVEGPVDIADEAAEQQTPPAEDEDAQAEDEAIVPQAEDVEVACFTPMASSDLPEPGVAGIGTYGGIRPSSDMRVFGTDDRHVFGAARARVISLVDDGGATSTWCFRVASVEVGGKMRTRVVATGLNGGYKGVMHILEFTTNIDEMPHEDLYDYDFALATQKFQGYYDEEYIQLAIVSGKRPGDDPTLSSVASDLVFSVLITPTKSFLAADTVITNYDNGWMSRRGYEVIEYQADWYHCISSIQMVVDPGRNLAGAITFLDRCAPNAGDVLGQKAEVRLGIIMFSFYDGIYLSTPSQASIDEQMGTIDDTTVYELALSPYDISLNEAREYQYQLMFRGSKAAHYVLMRVRLDATSYILEVASLTRCTDYTPDIRLVNFPAERSFLVSYPEDEAELRKPIDQRSYASWTLHKVTWSGDDTPKLVAEPIGPSGFNVTNFAVNEQGTFIFWPQTRDADEDRVRAADGTEDVTERPAVYHIMACRIRGGRFSDPFIVADLPNDTDMLAVVSTNQSAAVEMLRTEYVDTGDRGSKGKPLYHAADIWYTSVPAVRCATATACEAINQFVNPGGTAKFHVAVRNDGNVYLSGCTLTLCLQKDDGSYERVSGATAEVTFGKDTIQESNYNRLDENGNLTDVEDDYALAPGKTSVYAVTVNIPKDWESGEKKVLFVASDGVMADDTNLSAQSDDLSALAWAVDETAVEFYIEPGEYVVIPVRTETDERRDPSQRHMDTLFVEPDVAGGKLFEPAPVSVSGGGTPSGGGASGGGSMLPKTGDQCSPAGLGVVGAGLATLGAAVSAYERRRAENERLDQ